MEKLGLVCEGKGRKRRYREADSGREKEGEKWRIGARGRNRHRDEGRKRGARVNKRV